MEPTPQSAGRTEIALSNLDNPDRKSRQNLKACPRQEIFSNNMALFPRSSNIHAVGCWLSAIKRYKAGTAGQQDDRNK